jgi:uncharacterized iron-regulated membrane protein
MTEAVEHSSAGTRPAWVTVLNALGVIAALIWLVVAVTGILMTYKFEIDDSRISSATPPKDLGAIERRMDSFANAGGQAKVNFIWSTAGLKDRYYISYVTPTGEHRAARITGDGNVLLDVHGDQATALEWAREIHLTLVAGKTGEWILAFASIALLASIVTFLVRALRGRGAATSEFAAPRGRLETWYRRIGLIGAAPTFVVVLAATIIFFEHQIEGPIGAPPIKLAPIAPEGKGAGFAASARAAEAAIPGSRFVGVGMPKPGDATWYMWVNQPGEYFREQGYGGSLVVVNGNDASVRSAHPLQQASAAYKFIALPYPVHTGEIAGPIGRFLVMLTGFWLATMVVIGLILWNRRRKAAA